MTDSGNIRRRDLLRYGALAFPLAFAGMPLYIHAPDFYATEFGLSLGVLGVILLVIRAFDAVQDPLIGWLSDRYARLRMHIIAAGLVIFGASFLMMFHPTGQFTLLWFGVSMVLATTAFSIISINLNALGGVWTKDKHEKTRITSWREAIGLTGLLVAAALPTALKEEFPTLEAFHYLSLIFIGVLVIVGLVFFSWLSHHAASQAKTSMQLRASFSPAHKMFFTVYGLSMLASAIPGVLVIFFVRDRLGLEEDLGIFLLCYFLSGAASMPLWQWVAKRVGKYRSWLFAMVLAVMTFIWAFFLGEGDGWQYLVICIASGTALGAELALPPSILADLLEEKQSHAHASGHFSVMTFLAKAALAIATGTMFLVLEWSDFIPAEENSVSELLMLSLTNAHFTCKI